MAAAVKNLTFTDEELLLHVLVGFKTEKEGEGVDWETVKAKWDELNKKFIEKYHENFQEKFLRGVCKQQEQQHFWLILSSFCNQRRKSADRLTSLTKGA